MTAVEEALTAARDTFARYASEHRAKAVNLRKARSKDLAILASGYDTRIAETIKKAKHNEAMAAKMEAALAAITAAPAVERAKRQSKVWQWGVRAFGDNHMVSQPIRGLRLVEEAVEAYQAVGGPAEKAHLVVDHVFSRPPGQLPQELGGVAVTAYILAQSAGLSLDECEQTEIARVVAKSPAHFRRRNEEKVASGLTA